MQTVRITTSQNIDIDYEVAGVGERVLARLIDFALFFLLYILAIILAVFVFRSLSDAAFLPAVIIYAALFVFYDLICESLMNGQSIGKRIIKIKVISLDGRRPTFSQYLLRWLFRIVDFSLSFQLCGLICVAVSEKQQRVGDMVAGTTLIKTKPRTTADHLIYRPQLDDYVPVFTNASDLSDSDIELIFEVGRTYRISYNASIVHAAAQRIKEVLGITSVPDNMDDIKFLQTIVKDYTHLTAQADTL